MSQQETAREMEGWWTEHDPGAWPGKGCLYDLGVNYILIISIWLPELLSMRVRVRTNGEWMRPD